MGYFWPILSKLFVHEYTLIIMIKKLKIYITNWGVFVHEYFYRKEYFMSEVEWINIFGDNLIDIMNEQGYNQEQLADATGLTQATISKYINKKQMPSIKAIINLAYALDCTTDELIEFGDRII